MSRSVPEWIGKHDDQKVPQRVRQRVFDAYGGKCHLTGQIIATGQPWQLDHIIPLILGGEHRESNLAPALTEAHKAKTKTETAVKAKIAAVRQKHIGVTTSKQSIQSPGFAKREKPQRETKTTLPPRSLFRRNEE